MKTDTNTGMPVSEREHPGEIFMPEREYTRSPDEGQAPKTQEGAEAPPAEDRQAENGHDPAPVPAYDSSKAQAVLEQALDQMVAYAQPRIAAPAGAIEAAALWSAFTYIYRRPEIRKATRLLITAADVESGKTTKMELLRFTASHPYYTIKLTMPVLRDMLDAGHTMLLDEAEHYLGQIVTLADGWARGDTLPVKVAGAKGGWETVHYKTFAPVAIAMNNRPPAPPTVTTRSIRIHMIPGDAEIDWDDEQAPDDLEPVREGFRTWCSLLPPPEVYRLQLPYEPPDMPTRRTKQKWMPLFLVAAAAGPRWYEKALEAYRQLEGTAEKARSPQSLMLEAVWKVFQDCSEEYLLPTKLADKVQAQFSDRYDILKPTYMTQQLKMYKLDTRSVRIKNNGGVMVPRRAWSKEDIKKVVQENLIGRGVVLEKEEIEVEGSVNRVGWADAGDARVRMPEDEETE